MSKVDYNYRWVRDCANGGTLYISIPANLTDAEFRAVEKYIKLLRKFRKMDAVDKQRLVQKMVNLIGKTI